MDWRRITILLFITFLSYFTVKSRAHASDDLPSTTLANSTSTVLTCPRDPSGLENFNIKRATCENKTPKMTCEVHCKAGFKSGNGVTKTIDCQDDGTWSIPATKPCSKILCPSFPVSEPNTRYLTCSTKPMYINDSCDLNCKPGFEKWDWTSGSVTCKLGTDKRRGEWVGYQNKKCIKNSCAAPVFADRGLNATDCPVKETMVASGCNVQCRRGYAFEIGPRQTTILCQRSSAGREPVWSPALTTIRPCQKLSCSRLEFTSANNQPEIVGGCVNSQQSRCNLRCRNGYEFSDGASRKIVVCSLKIGDEEPSWTAVSCIKRRCEAPRFSDRLVDTTDCTTAKTLVDSECTVQCPRGYIFAGESRQKMIHCLRISPGIEPSWSPALTRIGLCRKLTCIRLDFTSAINQPEIVGHCGISQQSNCNLRCRNGYEFFNGNIQKAVICSLKNDDEEPSWPADIGTCRRLSCRPLEFTSGVHQPRIVDNCGTSQESECSLSCKIGYEFSDGNSRKTVECSLRSGEEEPSWPANIGTCRRMKCDEPNFGRNHIDSKSCKNKWYGDSCDVQCNAGYKFSNRKTKVLRCELSAEKTDWLPLPSTIEACQAITCPDIRSAFTTPPPGSFPPQMLNVAKCTSGRTTSGSKCILKCKEGYTFRNEKDKTTFTCDAATENWNVPEGGVGFCSVKIEKIANCEYWFSGTTANGKGAAELQCKNILDQTSVLAMPKTDIVRIAELLEKYQSRRYFVGAIVGNGSASWDNQADIRLDEDRTRTGTRRTGSCVVLWNGVLHTESCKISLRYMCERPIYSYNPCAINPCKSGGTCIPYGCSFKCKCLTDFYGQSCEKAPFDVNITTKLQQKKLRITCNVASNGGWAKFELYVNGRKEREITEVSTTKKVETYYVDRGTNDIYISGKIFLKGKPESAFYKWQKVSLPHADDFANITNDLCNGTVFHVVWNGLGNEITSALPYDVYVNNDLHGHAISKIYRVDGLAAATDYDIKVVPKLEGCTELGLFENLTKRTSRGLPGSSTVQLPATIDSSPANCTITWSNERKPKEIGGFKIKITEKINGYEPELAEPLSAQKLFEADVDEMKYSFSTNPNSIYEVMVGTKPLSICGDSPAWGDWTYGCRTDSAPPKEVRIPTTVIPNSEWGTVSMEIRSVDERNGRVCCYFVVLLKTDPSASENSTSGPIANMDQLAQANETIRDGDSFVALALPRFGGNMTLILGDGRTTCCDMSNSSMNCDQERTRRKRAADTVVRGENRQLNPGAKYRHYIVVSTPTESGDHVLTASVMSDLWSFDGGDRNNNAFVIALPVSFAILFVLIVVAIIIVRRKNTKSKVHGVPADHAMMPVPRRPNQEEAVIDVDHARVNPDDIVERHLSVHSFQLANLYQTMENKRADEDELFLEEFKGDINTTIAQCKLTIHMSQLPANRAKNRYTNIVPYDSSRVVLEKTFGNEFSDYINAAYIDGYKCPRKFIATQGPQPQTIGDFWRMVWEQECYIITVLTNLVEKKKVKCAQYWPEEETISKKYDSINVTFMECTTYGDYVRRKFEVSRDGKTRTIFQFHFIAWPDHGIPNTTSSILRFHKSVIYSQPPSAGPIVVHCSAGVGRTGTFIALDILSEQISETEEINICALVGKMRTKRPEMVQTLDQYIYIHKLVLELYQFGETDVEVSGFNAAYNNLRRINGQQSEIEQEFAMLDYFLPLDTDNETAQIHKHLNRNSDVLPYDHNAAFIQMIPTDRSAPYYNASEIASYHANDKFIAAQTPDENSIEMFWRTVFDNNVSMIVSLCETKEEANYCFWPMRSKVVKHGSVSVRTIEEVTDMGCVERKFEVANKDQKISVSQIFYENWPENVVPASSGIVLEIIARVERHHQTLGNSEKKTTLVHCSDGSGRSGTFCAISNLIERLKNENLVDVFRTVKDLRDQRPKMVQSLEQYEFCFKAVNDFLQSFDLYGNFQ